MITLITSYGDEWAIKEKRITKNRKRKIKLSLGTKRIKIIRES